MPGNEASVDHLEHRPYCGPQSPCVVCLKVQLATGVLHLVQPEIVSAWMMRSSTRLRNPVVAERYPVLASSTRRSPLKYVHEIKLTRCVATHAIARGSLRPGCRYIINQSSTTLLWSYHCLLYLVKTNFS